ncbi:sensor histidine kinase [Auritidibacter ignavus]|uniref:sensor histidine kinase n=1 Tax=Auritidibacter ignavus TaxID=678932 RepID=UPI00109D71B3|nr:histidine kinase [Auritidibacter ignavus]
MMNPLRILDRFSTNHPMAYDAIDAGLIWLVLVFPSNVLPVSDPSFWQLWYWPPALPLEGIGVYTLILATLHMATWVIRRRAPVFAAGVVVVLGLIQLALGPMLIPSMVIIPMMVYNLAKNAPRWASLAGLITGVLAAIAYGLRVIYSLEHYVLTADHPALQTPLTAEERAIQLDFTSTTGDYYLYPAPGTETFESRVVAGIMLTVICALLVLAPWAFGDLARTRKLAVSRLQDRARQLEVEATQERALAAADERNRIAREMHDIIAHSLQVIISQADGGRYAGTTNPQLALDTLDTVADTGRDALHQMRGLLGVLRDTETTDYAPQPGLADLDDLIATVQLTGLHVTLTSSGTPARSLPAGAELVIYRTVQEALTNTGKHAGEDARASVMVRWRPTGVAVTIDDTGGTGESSQTGESNQTGEPGQTPPPGHGLMGMRDRLNLYSGILSAGPRHDGSGFRVHAEIPYEQN